MLFYFQNDFCLDISLNYCEGADMKPTLRAIISDQKLHGSKMATVYGSSSDNDTIRIFKQVGYGISIFFLLLTLAIYFVIKEVRTVSFHLKNSLVESIYSQ